MAMKKIAGFIKLTRPYISLSATPFFIGPAFLSANGIPPAGPFFIGFLAVVLAIAAAHVCNDYFDWKIDAKNPRTVRRAIPSGLISPREAFIFGSALAIAALALTFLLNTPAILVALAAISLPFIYVYLRRRKIPLAFLCPVAAVVLIILFGSASATGKVITSNVWLFLALALLWEPGRDFISEIQDVAVDEASGILTLPVVLSPRTAAKVVLALFLAASIVGVLIGFQVGMGIVYFTASSSAGSWLVFRSIGLVSEPTTKNAVKMRIRAPRYLIIMAGAISIDFVIASFA